MKFIYCTLFIFIFTLTLTGFGNTQPYNVKLAIFDNLKINNDPNFSNETEKKYLYGVKTAITAAKKSNLIINDKSFFYGDSLLNILQKIPIVKHWNPDVVIGLSSSNASFMSKGLLDKQQLVLSISATDIGLKKLPTNFYSLGVPDSYAAKAIVHFIKNYYPDHSLLIVIGADSKESTDLGSLVAADFKVAAPNQTATIKKFLSDAGGKIDLSSLAQSYKKNDVILLFSLAGSYGTQIKMMNKISDYLSPNKLVFINDVDNWEGNTLPGNVNNNTNSYTAYRIDTLYVNKKSSAYKKFSTQFKKIYGIIPNDKISFITYRAVMSFVEALKEFPPTRDLSVKQSILFSYHEALKHNPNWYRPMEVAVYKLHGNHEFYFANIK